MFSLAQAVTGAVLLALTTASEPAAPSPQQFQELPPWVTIDQMREDIVGGDNAFCEVGGEAVQVVVAELHKDGIHYTVWAREGRWAMARYPADQNLPDLAWYGDMDKRNLAVKQTLPYKPGMDPCADWLTPKNG